MSRKEGEKFDEILDPFDVNQNERGGAEDLPPSREKPFWDTRNPKQNDREKIED
ncbi:MAG: hypothetical protein M1383_03250 [Patescibacteria group bacterium]|nr:hypothetical protein [Patescibacteria group bacterium]